MDKPTDYTKAVFVPQEICDAFEKEHQQKNLATTEGLSFLSEKLLVQERELNELRQGIAAIGSALGSDRMSINEIERRIYLRQESFVNSLEICKILSDHILKLKKEIKSHE